MIFLAARIHQGGSSLSIYGEYYPTLKYIQDYLIKQIELYADTTREETGEAAFEHLITRIKSEDSMREKCERKGIESVASGGFTVNTRCYRHSGCLPFC